MIGVSAIAGMAYGTLVGGFLQFAVQWPSLRRAGFGFRPRLDISDPGVRQILRLLGPAIIGTAAVQINVFINTNFASAIVDPATGTIVNGPVSWLNYAFRFMQFPIGVFGVAIATATLPTLVAKLQPAGLSRISPDPRPFIDSGISLVHSVGARTRRIRAADHRVDLRTWQVHQLRHGANRQCLGRLLVWSRRLRRDQSSFSGLLRAPGRAHADADQSRLDSRQFRVELLARPPFGHVGLAFSTSSVALVNFTLLALLMRRRLGGMEGRRLGSAVLRIFAAAVPMAAGCMARQ